MSTHHRPAWAPDAVEIEVPSAAPMYDHYLNGPHNFAADRVLAQQASMYTAVGRR
jgi:hypothetical protein